MHMVSDDGLNFSVCDPILSKSYACHNFSAYVGADNAIEAIGGQIGPLNMPHNDGLYQFASEDGYTFREMGKLIASDHPKYINGMSWGLDAELDGHHCCLYDQTRRRHVLFIRANTGRGQRAIQTTYREAPFGYGEFSLIRIGRQIQDSYYTANFFKVGLLVFGLVPFVIDNFCSLRIIASYNYHDWWICGDLFKTKPWYNEENKPKNRDHPVQGVIDRGSFVEFYVHHNYLGYDESAPVSIKRYRIAKQRLYYSALLGGRDAVLQRFRGR